MVEEYDVYQDIEAGVEKAYTIDIKFTEPNAEFNFAVRKGWYVNSAEKAIVMRYARGKRIADIVEAVLLNSKAVKDYKKMRDSAALFEILRDDMEKERNEAIKRAEVAEKKVTDMQAKSKDLALLFSRYITGEITDTDLDWISKQLRQYRLENGYGA